MSESLGLQDGLENQGGLAGLILGIEEIVGAKHLRQMLRPYCCPNSCPEVRLQDILTDQGAVVEVAYTGQEGLARAAALPIW